MWATTTGSFLLFLFTTHYLLVLNMLLSHVLSVHQEKNKERFKFQETHSWQEVYYDIQTRGLDLIHKKREAERRKKSNDLFLQQTITKEWNYLRFTKWVHRWCQ